MKPLQKDLAYHSIARTICLFLYCTACVNDAWNRWSVKVLAFAFMNTMWIHSFSLSVASVSSYHYFSCFQTAVSSSTVLLYPVKYCLQYSALVWLVKTRILFEANSLGLFIFSTYFILTFSHNYSLLLAQLFFVFLDDCC